jgi:hypothetical protein
LLKKTEENGNSNHVNIVFTAARKVEKLDPLLDEENKKCQMFWKKIRLHLPRRPSTKYALIDRNEPIC